MCIRIVAIAYESVIIITFLRHREVTIMTLQQEAYSRIDQMTELKWNPRFQFAKVNPCFGILLQE